MAGPTDGSDTAPDAERPLGRRLRATFDPSTRPGGYNPTRRDALIGGAATWATVSLAGCSSVVGNGDSGPQNYVVTDEVIAAGNAIPPGAGGWVKGCAPQRQFVGGMRAVWKIGVFDPATGEHVTDDTIDEMTVDLSNGVSVEMSWNGDREERPADEWSGSWEIPEDAQPGELSYTVKISNSDANYKNFGIESNQINIIELTDPTTFVVEADTTTTSDAIPSEVGVFGGACGPQQQFIAGMKVVFHVGVWDPRTGNRVGPEVVDAMSIALGNGETIELEWIGDAEEHASPEWEGSWVIPEGTEPGTLEYTVEIQSEGSTMMVGVLSDEIEIGTWPPEEESS